MSISTVLEGIKLAMDWGLTPLLIESDLIIVAIWTLIRYQLILELSFITEVCLL